MAADGPRGLHKNFLKNLDENNILSLNYGIVSLNLDIHNPHIHRGLCHCFEHGQQQLELELELVVDPGLLASKSILASVSPPFQFYSVGAKKVFTSGKVGRKYYMKWCVCVVACLLLFQLAGFTERFPSLPAC